MVRYYLPLECLLLKKKVCDSILLKIDSCSEKIIEENRDLLSLEETCKKQLIELRNTESKIETLKVKIADSKKLLKDLNFERDELQNIIDNSNVVEIVLVDEKRNEIILNGFANLSCDILMKLLGIICDDVKTRNIIGMTRIFYEWCKRVNMNGVFLGAKKVFRDRPSTLAVPSSLPEQSAKGINQTTIIRSILSTDIPAISDIYNYYVESTVVTFEEEPVPVCAMETRMRDITHTQHFPWLVAETADGEVVGYAYAHRWHERVAYRFAAEDSIYIKHGWERKGLGERLLVCLLDKLKARDLHVLMSVITVPNAGSVGLHEKYGFKKSGQFNEVGYKMDRWLDVGYWELIF